MTATKEFNITTGIQGKGDIPSQEKFRAQTKGPATRTKMPQEIEQENSKRM
jgi:hypothetical protein